MTRSTTTLLPALLLCSLLGTPAGAQRTGNLAESPEPNDSILTASVMQCGRQAAGEIVSAPFPDTDYWGFTLSEAREVLITVSPREGSECFYLGLYDAFGTLTTTGIGGTIDGCYSYIRVNLTAGTYYVSVISGAMTPGGLIPTTGHYALDLVCSAPSPDVPCAAFGVQPEAEPNDLLANAQPLACCTEIVGTLGQLDTDTFRLDVTTRQQVALNWQYTSPLVSGVLPRLLAADGTTIAFFVGSPSVGYRLQRLLEPGTYYVVDSLGFFFTLDYTLRLDCRPITGPFEFATHSLSGTACTGIAGNTPTIVTYPNEVPLLGSTYSVFLTDTDDGNAPYVWALLGVDPIYDPGIDLGPLGAPGCELYVNPVVTLQLTNDVFLPTAGPLLTLEWFIVNNPTVLGQSFSVQGVVSSPPELLTTNVLSATVGNWLPQ